MQRAKNSKWTIFAFQNGSGANPGDPVEGLDTTNLFLRIWQDGSIAGDYNNPTELDGGLYIFDVPASAIMAGDHATAWPFQASSPDPTLQLIAVPAAVWLSPTNFPETGIETDGDLSAVLVAESVGSLDPDSIAETSFESNAISSRAVAAGALNGKGDWNIGKAGYSLSASQSFNNTGQSASLPANVTGADPGSLNGAGDWNIGKAGYSLSASQSFNNAGQTASVPARVTSADPGSLDGAGDWSTADQLSAVGVTVDQILTNQTTEIPIPTGQAPPTSLTPLVAPIWTYKLLHAKREQDPDEERIFEPGGVTADLRRDKAYDDPTQTVTIGELEASP